MNEQQPSGAGHHVTISGGVSGQVAVGNHNTQVQAATPALSDAELQRLREAFDQLQARVAAEAPPQHWDQAAEQIAKLERAVFADQPAVDQIAAAPGWFERDTPKLASLVRDRVVHPAMDALGRTGGETTAPASEEPR
jgi:hypothetical protein